MFEAFYNGPIHHPFLLWAAALLALARCRTVGGVHPSLRRTASALAVLSLIDAWWTSAHVFGVGPLSGAAASLVPLFFVLAGDFRYLVLVTSGTPEGAVRPTVRTLAAAAGLTLIVPAFSQGVLFLLPDSVATPRVLFWLYEASFVVLALALLRWHPNLASNAWLRRVSGFVIAYYSLWAAVDTLLLATGVDWGYLLRIVPNLLYYGGFIAAIVELAPRQQDPR